MVANEGILSSLILKMKGNWVECLHALGRREIVYF